MLTVMMETACEELRLGMSSVMRARCWEGRVEMTLVYFSDEFWSVVIWISSISENEGIYISC